MDNRYQLTVDPDIEPLVGVSLDSVVQKASDLACVLQTCKLSLEYEQSLPVNGRINTTHSWSITDRSHTPKALPATSLQQPTSPAPSNDVLLEQWQQLTSYIVSLEKEVQYYKQLVEECQQVQALYASAGSSQTEITQGNNGQRVQSVSSSPSSEERVIESEATNMKVDDSRSHAPSHNGDTARRKRSVVTDQQYWDKMLESDRMSRALLLVFCHLSTHELCAVSRVCRRWNTVSKHPLLWTRVSFYETVLHPQVLQGLSKMCTNTEKLALHGLMPSMTECDEDLSSYISRTRGSLEEAVEAILTNCSQTLVSLSLTECNLMITERILWLTSVHCPNLKSFSYCSDEFPPSSESLWSMTNGCRHLKHLSLPPVLGSPNESWFGDSALRVIANGWPNLVSLTVGGKTITADGLAEVAQSCLNLCYLELIHGPDMGKQAVTLLCQDNALTSLTTLILNFTPSTHVAIGHVLAHCPKLQRLDLHVTLHSYFPTDTSNADNISAYEQIIRNLKKLEKHKKGKQVFHLFEHYSGV